MASSCKSAWIMHAVMCECNAPRQVLEKHFSTKVKRKKLVCTISIKTKRGAFAFAVVVFFFSEILEQCVCYDIMRSKRMCVRCGLGVSLEREWWKTFSSTHFAYPFFPTSFLYSNTCRVLPNPPIIFPHLDCYPCTWNSLAAGMGFWLVAGFVRLSRMFGDSNEQKKRKIRNYFYFCGFPYELKLSCMATQ